MLKPYALTSVGAVRRYLDEDTADQALLERLINGVSRSVMKEYKRQFAPPETAVTKTFSYGGNGVLHLGRWEARTVTAITVAQFGAAAVALSSGVDYALGLKTDEDTYLTLRFATVLDPARVAATVSVTGDWGMLEVPEDVALAVEITIDNLYSNPEAGEERELGGERIVETVDAGNDTMFPARAREILEGYRRPTGA